MGLLQQAVKTYDVMDNIGVVGKYEEGKEPLAPIAHTIITAKIEVTINDKSEFVNAEKIEKNIIIPITDNSLSRSGSKPIAHPLSDQLKYLFKNNKEAFESYYKQLCGWVDSEFSNLPIKLIKEYISQNDIKNDIDKTGITYNDTDYVSWKIIGLGKQSCCLHVDNTLINSYIKYYNSLRKNECVCFVTGQKMSYSSKYPYFIGKKRLISKQEEGMIKYSGRFNDCDEALSLSFESISKSHNILKWLISNQSVNCYGNQKILVWNPNGKKLYNVLSPILPSTNNKISPTDYKEQLKKVILSDKRFFENEDIIIVVFDEANQGRVSIIYYNEIKGNDYFDKLFLWDNVCSFISNNSNRNISSPYLKDIIKYTIGKQNGTEEKDDIIISREDYSFCNQLLQKLIYTKINGCMFPKEIFIKLVNNSNNLMLYNKKNRKKLLFITCAVIKKYIYDYKREDTKMSLDQDKKDRSYQYGRLLAVLEKIEKDTYSKDEKRETNAIRMQSVFVKRPAYASKIIIEQLNNSYFTKLRRDKPGLSVKYDKMIGQIMNILSEYEEDYNKPLTETYLLGYYLQRNAFYEKNNQLEEVK